VARAIARHEAGTARVIPIILKPVDWRSAPFGTLPALPKEGKAVTRWRPQAEAFADIARGIRAAAGAETAAHRPGPPARPDLLLHWRTFNDIQAPDRLLAGHRGAVYSMAVSPDGRRIVSGSDDDTVAVWDLESGHRLASLMLEGQVLCVAWHPDGRSILVADGHGNLYRLDYREP
jgi:hypothetical protein